MVPYETSQKKREYLKRYYQREDVKARRREQAKRYNLKYPERVKKRKQEYFQKNKAEIIRKDHPRKMQWKKTPKGVACARRAILKRSGWTPEEYDKTFLRQHGLCAIPSCGKPIEDADHHHESMTPRELLCHGCNMVLGFSDERVQVLADIVDYIQKHENRRREGYNGSVKPE